MRRTNSKTWADHVRSARCDIRAIWRVLTNKHAPIFPRIVAGCTIAYLVSPIQLIPNFIPVIGQMDDLLVLYVGLKLIRRLVPQSVLEEKMSLSVSISGN